MKPMSDLYQLLQQRQKQLGGEESRLDRLSDWWFDRDWVEIVCGGIFSFLGIIIVLITLCLPYIIYLSVQNDVRLKEECMADGRKEYECVSMLRSQTVPMPIPIIIR